MGVKNVQHTKPFQMNGKNKMPTMDAQVSCSECLFVSLCVCVCVCVLFHFSSIIRVVVSMVMKIYRYIYCWNTQKRICYTRKNGTIVRVFSFSIGALSNYGKSIRAFAIDSPFIKSNLRFMSSCLCVDEEKHAHLSNLKLNKWVS